MAPVPEEIVIAPETVRLLVPEKVIPLAVFPPFIAILAQEAVVLMVTVTPLLIVTASLAVGTEDPPQVVVLFQLPDTEAVRCAFNAVAVTSNTSNIL